MHFISPLLFLGMCRSTTPSFLIPRHHRLFQLQYRSTLCDACLSFHAFPSMTFWYQLARPMCSWNMARSKRACRMWKETKKWDWHQCFVTLIRFQSYYFHIPLESTCTCPQAWSKSTCQMHAVVHEWENMPVSFRLGLHLGKRHGIHVVKRNVWARVGHDADREPRSLQRRSDGSPAFASGAWHCIASQDGEACFARFTHHHVVS